eukprot:UN03354
MQYDEKTKKWVTLDKNNKIIKNDEQESKSMKLPPKNLIRKTNTNSKKSKRFYLHNSSNNSQQQAGKEITNKDLETSLYNDLSENEVLLSELP